MRVIGISISEPVTVLDLAKRLVVGDRHRSYGDPAGNHGTTAAMFAAYLERKHGVRVELDAIDVCWFNVLQKVSRDAHRPERDNLVDVAGYAENIDRIREGRTC